MRIFNRKDNEIFELLLLGDTGFGENYQEKQKQEENILEQFGYEYSLEKMKPILMSSDLVIVNLETALTNISESPFFGQKKDYAHWSHIEKAPQALVKNNISVVSLANNHSFDYGVEGYIQTLDILKKYNISVIGAGNNITEAAKPFFGKIEFESKTFKFAIISAFEIIPTYRKIYKVYADTEKSGLMPLDLDIISFQVKKLKEIDPDIFVILFPHWGDNYSWHHEDQAQKAEELLKSGIDMIMGHGSHMIQKFENLDNHLVVYSVGNFIYNFPGHYEKFKVSPYSYVAKFVVSLVNNNFDLLLRLYPIFTDNKTTNYQPRFLTDNEFDNFYSIIVNTDKQEKLVKKQDQYGSYVELPIVHSTFKSKNSSDKKIYIGMISGILKDQNFEKYISLWMHRAFVIEPELIKQGYKLFCFPPENVDLQNKIVQGYILEDGYFKKITILVPRINYDWYIGEKNLYGKNGFVPWALAQGIEIIPGTSIRKLAGDKLESSKFFSNFDNSIVPITTEFTGEIDILDKYLSFSNTIFIKPRYGSMGNGILVISLEKNSFLVNYYFEKEKTSRRFKLLSETLSFIKEKIDKDAYIIQAGIDIVHYEDSVFDVRSLMVNDGKTWHFLSEVRLSQQASDLSNVSQGGHNHNSETFLGKIFSIERASIILNKIKRISTDLAIALAKNHTNMNEIAFDFLIDKDEKIYIAEMNTKPGLIGTPQNFDNFLKMTDYEKEVYETLCLKHGEYLAKYLINKAKSKSAE